VADRFIGRDTSIRDCYAAAFRRLLPLIGLMLTLGLILGLAAVPCLIPYFILAPRLFVATQCLVLEDLGVGAAIERSWRLTQGYFWPILGLVAVLLVFGIILNQIAKVPQNLLLQMFESIPVAMVISLGASILLSTLSAILGAVAAVVVYFDLRTRKEALDMEGLLNLVDEIGPGYEKEGEPT
jgi:membrane-anchored glycerophosphoryl diester phosphodiesterase (GDPDase)